MFQKLLPLFCFSAFITGCGSSTENPPNSTNNAPTVSAISIVDRNGGSVTVGDILEGQYTYSDSDGDAEGASIYQWLRSPSSSSSQQTSFTVVPGANGKTYTVTTADIGYQLILSVIPVAQTGVTQGTATTPSLTNSAGSSSILQR